MPFIMKFHMLYCVVRHSTACFASSIIARSILLVRYTRLSLFVFKNTKACIYMKVKPKESKVDRITCSSGEQR